MFLHQGTDIVINFVYAATNITHLKTISNVQIPACFIAATLTKLTGRCILEVEIDEVISTQNHQLVMIPTFIIKDDIEPAYTPIILINLSSDVIQIAKYTVIRILQQYTDIQGPKKC